MILEKPVRQRDNDYLAFVRTFPCLVRKVDGWEPCTGPVDAHHVTVRGHGTMGGKADDDRTVPLCRLHHALYHSIGRDTFESRFALILTYEIQRLRSIYEPPLKKLSRNHKPCILKIEVRCICHQKTHKLAPSKVHNGWDCPILKQRIAL